MSEPLFCTGQVPETTLYRAIEEKILSRYPDVSVKHDRTQTAFVRAVQFAWVSMPRRKADAGAVTLSIGLPSRMESPRIQYAAEVAPGRWMHHLLIRSADELDDEALEWLDAAWALLGPGQR